MRIALLLANYPTNLFSSVQAMKHGDVLYTSGSIGLDPKTGVRMLAFQHFHVLTEPIEFTGYRLWRRRS